MPLIRRRYRGIQAFYGLPGSGKSYELAHWGLRQLSRGRPVWCSAGFELPGAHTFHSVEEFVSIPDGSAVCLDEAPLWLDARGWSKLDPLVLVRLTQVRKYGIELRYSCIHPSMVEVTLRRVTFDWFEVRPFLGPFNRLRAAKSPEGSPKLRDDHGPWRYRRMRQVVWDAFDTSAVADVSSWRSGRLASSTVPAVPQLVAPTRNGADHP